MDESAALDVVAMRAIETADGARTVWSDDDRAWASRAAAEVVGAQASAAAFLARRAALALERLGARDAALPRAVRALRWRPWIGNALVVVAFVTGIVVDRIGAGQRINVLAPPVLALLAWNLAVYLLLFASYVVHYGEDTARPLREALARTASGLKRPRVRGALRVPLVALVHDWARTSAALYASRAARILHVAAAALAAGLVAGLYLRGLALEYRASWESTFLDASAVRRILSVAYAPGAMLTGIPVPAVDAVAAIRAPAAENAARWLHLMAATVFAVIVAPRLALALYAGVVERHRARRLPLALDEPYFRRLLRRFHGPARVRVIPYSYSVPPEHVAGLETIVARAFGGTASMSLAAAVPYGGEPSAPAEPGTTVAALFNATATPERETHGAFLAALARQCAQADALVALVDESAFAARWGGSARVDERRAAWRATCEQAGVPIVFADLAAPDAEAAEAALDEALGDRAQ